MKSIHEDVVKKIKQQWNAGLDKQEIAAQAGVSVSLVEAISSNGRHAVVEPQIDSEIRKICKRGYTVPLAPKKRGKVKSKNLGECEMAACTRKAISGELCATHLYDKKNPRKHIRSSIETIEEYLLRIRVIVAKPSGEHYKDIDSECWLFPYINSSHGYGMVGYKGKRQRTHKWAYELWNGEIRDMFVLHKCDVTACFNPKHLYLGTQQDNMKDRTVRARY